MNEFWNAISNVGSKYLDYRTQALTAGRAPGSDMYGNQIGTRPLPNGQNTNAQPTPGFTLQSAVPYLLIGGGLIVAVVLIRAVSK